MKHYMTKRVREDIERDKNIFDLPYDREEEFNEFRKWAIKKGLTDDNSPIATIALILEWSREDNTVKQDDILKGLNKRVLAYEKEETEKAHSILK